MKKIKKINQILTKPKNHSKKKKKKKQQQK